MKTLDMCFKFILDNDDAYFSGSDKLIVREWVMTNYHINGELTISDDLVVNCSGGVEVKNKSITSLTNGLFSWGVIGDGYFNCNYCKNLKTLEGAPKEVIGMFSCSFCDRLKTLKGAPKEIDGSFDCCKCINLTSLEGAPKKMSGGFYCNRCDNLTSLEGAPKEVGWSFVCNHCNNLTSLKGAPKKIGRLFDCGNCPNLEITDSDREKYKLHKYLVDIPQTIK